MGENNEDLLDIFACAALIGMSSDGRNDIGNPKYADYLSRLCYVQAQSMLLVRKEFVKEVNDE